MQDTTSVASHNIIGTNTNQFGEFEVNGFQSIVAITLDDLSEVKGVLLPNHIKLDVDGRELEILKGSSKLLLTIETILVEIEGSNRGENLEDIENLLSNAGLIEDTKWRDKGSGRNRLYKRDRNL